MRRLRTALVLALTTLVLAVAAAATAAPPTVGTSFPAGFPVITDASLGKPVIGFGAAGKVHRTPVILLHGNNDTPYPTACNPFGSVHALAQYLVDHGYAPSEVWALGYQGDQCDLLADQTLRSGVAHSTLPNVPDLDAFVRAVLKYTHAKEVDIVGHSLGVTLARAWMKQEHAGHLVRRFVAIDGPNHGIINCSPNPANYWQLPALGGFTPDSAVCLEYGAPDTPLPPLAERTGLEPRALARQGSARQDRLPRHPQRGHELRLLRCAGRRSSRQCRPRTGSASRPISRTAPSCAARPRST